MANDKTIRIRAALAQLDPKNDQHWTDDGLPREDVVRNLANDQTLSRRDIQLAQPGLQRNPVAVSAAPPAGSGADAAHDPLTGEGLGSDPTKNTGELMTDAEVRAELERRVTAANQELADAQQGVRDANKRVIDAQTALRDAKIDLTREFPPLSAAANVKEYLASELAQRAARAGVYGGQVPGSQIDAAMARSNSRGWRRPNRNKPVQTGAYVPAGT